MRWRENMMSLERDDKQCDRGITSVKEELFSILCG